VLKGDGFRREFAQDNVQRRDDGEPKGDRNGVRRGLAERDREQAQRGLDHRRHRRFANPPQAEAGHRDRQLVARCSSPDL